MTVWNFISTHICFSMDGISVSWLFVAGIFALLWLKRIVTVRRK